MKTQLQLLSAIEEMEKIVDVIGNISMIVYLGMLRTFMCYWMSDCV